MPQTVGPIALREFLKTLSNPFRLYARIRCSAWRMRHRGTPSEEPPMRLGVYLNRNGNVAPGCPIAVNSRYLIR